MKNKTERLWNTGYILLLVANIINFTGFGIVTPQIPRFAVSLGATLATAGLITGVFPFAALVGRPFASIMGDRLNKKHLLIIAFILNGLITISHMFVPSLFWLVPVRVFHGLVFSINSTLAIALSVDYVPKEKMGEGIGILGLANIIGMALGPNIGIFLVESFSFRLSFAISGVVIITAGVAVLFLKHKNTLATMQIANDCECINKKRRFHINDVVAVKLLPNVAFVAVFMLGTGLVNSYMVILGYERDICNVGLYFIVNAIVALATRYAIGRIIDNKGVAYAILPGYIFGAAGMITIGFAFTLWHLLVGAVFFSIAAGCGLSAIQTDCIKRLPSDRRAVATGTYFIGLDMGMIIGPMVGGLVADFYGFNITFYGAGVLMLLGFVAYLLYSLNRPSVD